jgi:hypothetical protein
MVYFLDLEARYVAAAADPDPNISFFVVTREQPALQAQQPHPPSYACQDSADDAALVGPTRL